MSEQADATASTDPSPDLNAGVASPATEEVGGGVSPVALPEMVTVKVDGEEMQVSLDEALNGYSRTADYTRKTQALAAEREQLSHAEQLWNAIESNPETTIKAIADAYGINFGQAQAAPPSDDLDLDAGPTTEVDPRWQKVESFMEQAHMSQLQQQIDSELRQVHQKYGREFDDEQLLRYAVDHQIGNLDDAFKAFVFDATMKVAGDRKVQQQKASAPPVAGGHGIAAGAVAPGTGPGPVSMAEAFAAAEAAHGAA